MIALAVVMALEVLNHFSPGAMSVDSFAILAQARSGVYSDAHPPLMAMIWSVTDQVIPGPFGMLLTNLVLFYGGLLLIFLWCAQRYGFICLPLFVVVGLYPPVTAILGVIWIDVTMAAFFIGAIGIFLFFGLNERSTMHKVAAVFSLLLILLGLSLRHNGAAAALPLFIFVFYYSISIRNKIWFRVVSSVALGVLCTFLCFWGVRQANVALTDVKADLWRVGAVYDIAGVSFYEGRYLFDRSIMDGGERVDIETLYSPRSYIPLMTGEQIHALSGSMPKLGKKVELDLKNVNLNKALFSNWVSVVVEHPGAYLKHRYGVFLSLVTRSPWGLWSTIYDWTPPNSLGVPERTATDSRYFELVRRSIQTFLFVPVYYLLLSLLAVVPALYFSIKIKSEPLTLSVMLYSSGILHMVGLFFFAASGDNRYSHWMIFTTVLATAVLFADLALGLAKRFRNN